MSYFGPSKTLDESNFVVEELLNAASNDMTVDGSTTAVTFKAAPGSGKVWLITRLLIYLSDAVDFGETDFGAVAGPLTNGVGIMCNNTEIHNWKDNLDIQLSMFDADGKGVFGKTARSIAGRWTFAKHGAVEGLRITDTTNGFALKIQDDLTGLDTFRACIEGIEIDA